MLLELKRVTLPAILVAAAGLGSCGEQQPSPGDEDRLQQDGGEVETDEKPAAASAAKPAAAPARPVGLPQSGRPAPGLSLPSVEHGETWTLAQHLDPDGQSCPKGFLVAFMASWCTYCTQSLPTLVELEQANPELAVVTVTVDDKPEMQKAELDKVRKAGLTGPVLAADAAAVQAWIGSGKSVPKYYFIDHNGTITAKDDGFGDKVKPLMPTQAKRALRD